MHFNHVVPVWFSKTRKVQSQKHIDINWMWKHYQELHEHKEYGKRRKLKWSSFCAHKNSRKKVGIMKLP